MGSNNPFSGDGASINRPPVFSGEGYAYWKVCLRIYIEAIDTDIWDSVVNGPYIPLHMVDGESKEKPKGLWTNIEKRKVQHDLKAKNIITSALSYDELLRVSQYLNAKRNIGYFATLDKTFTNADLSNKVLRCLDRKWKPKVTAIMESKNLDNMPLATLFGKLQEHEMELGRLTMNEESDKNRITLKATRFQEDQESEDSSLDSDSDEDLTLIFEKFKKYLKKKGGIKNLKKEAKNSTKKSKIPKEEFTCYECGKSGHMKHQCPSHLKKFDNKKSNSRMSKSKEAYIV
nr:transposon Pol polyprotein [Lupinus angustifolius]